MMILERMMPKEYLDHLLTEERLVHSERRVVTILFMDMVGSTRMAETMDPEEFMKLINGAFEVLIEPVLRYGGTLARLMGDGFLCFFGAPVAHEDDPVRACRAGLEIVQKCRQYGRKARRQFGVPDFNVRVGINTGLVVVGEVGAKTRVEYTAMGDAINLAARMENLADPGTVLVTESTYSLIARRFRCKDLGVVRIRGREKEVRLFRPLGVLDESASRGKTDRMPFLGRADDIGELCLLLSNPPRDAGMVIAIRGDAGVGKTRFFEECYNRIGLPPTLMKVRCLEQYRQSTFWSARDLLLRAMGLGRVPTAAVLEKTLVRQMGDPVPRDLPEGILPFLARILGVPPSRELSSRTADLEPAELNKRTSDAFAAYLSAVHHQSPAVILWDDLQWIDASSLQMITDLVKSPRPHQPLFVLVYRNDDPALQEFHEKAAEFRGGSYRLFDLRPLPREEALHLIRALRTGKELPDDVTERVYRQTDGNPFFIEEVLRSMDGPLQSAETEIPVTLQGAIMARIDQLTLYQKHVLQTAAVIGRVFPRAILEEMVSPEVSSEMKPTLAALCELNFLEKEEDSPGGLAALQTGDRSYQGIDGGNNLYRFCHSLTVQVACGSMLRSRLKELHRKAGETIERHWPGEKGLSSILALHFGQAEDPDKTASYLVEAGRYAAQLSAQKEAEEFFQKALSMDGPNGRVPRVRTKTIAEAHEELGDLYYRMSNYQSAASHYDKALSVVETARHRSDLHRKVGQVFERTGNYGRAKEAYEKGLEVMQPSFDFAAAARIYAALGLVYYHLGDLQNATELCSLSLQLSHDFEDRYGEARASNNLGIVYAKLEKWDSAEIQYRAALRFHEEERNVLGQAAVHNNIGLVMRAKGEPGRAFEHFGKSIELFKKVGNTHGLSRAYDNLSQVCMGLGRKDEAMQYLKEGVSLMAGFGDAGQSASPEMWQSDVWG